MSQSFFGTSPTLASVRVSNSGYLFWTLLRESLEAAAEHSQRAIDLARQSGHKRTERAGLINLSHALQGLGEFGAAKRCIADVQRSVGADKQFNLALLDSKANVLISEGSFEDAGPVLEELQARPFQAPLRNLVRGGHVPRLQKLNRAISCQLVNQRWRKQCLRQPLKKQQLATTPHGLIGLALGCLHRLSCKERMPRPQLF